MHKVKDISDKEPVQAPVSDFSNPKPSRKRKSTASSDFEPSEEEEEEIIESQRPHRKRKKSTTAKTNEHLRKSQSAESLTGDSQRSDTTETKGRYAKIKNGVHHIPCSQQ